MTISDLSECIVCLRSIRKAILAFKGKRNLPSAFFFFVYLGDRMIFSFLWLALSATTDKLLNHSDRGTAGLFPGVFEKRIGLLSLLPTYDQLLP